MADRPDRPSPHGCRASDQGRGGRKWRRTQCRLHARAWPSGSTTRSSPSPDARTTSARRSSRRCTTTPRTTAARTTSSSGAARAAIACSRPSSCVRWSRSISSGSTATARPPKTSRPRQTSWRIACRSPAHRRRTATSIRPSRRRRSVTACRHDPTGPRRREGPAPLKAPSSDVPEPCAERADRA